MNKSIRKIPPSRTSDQFVVRFYDDGMRQQLKVRAALNERTLNAEILYLVKKGLAAEAVVLTTGAQQ